MDLLSWSLRLFRVSGITVRAHWSLLVIILYDLFLYVGRAGLPWWLGFAFVGLLFISILLHEFGHALTARAVGGDCRTIVMWMMGGLAECQVPMRPWRQFVVSAAGPAVTGLIALAAWGLSVGLRDWAGGEVVRILLGYTVLVNVRLLLFNLIPCYPLDGGRMLLSVAWAGFGMRWATTITLCLSYPSVIAMIVWAIWSDNSLFFGLSLWLLMSLAQEHQSLRRGGSAFGLDLGYDNGRTDTRSWLGRWREGRRQHARERREKEEDAEQETLDRLLDKVTNQGLPALTADERAALERISRRQRARAEAERV